MVAVRALRDGSGSGSGYRAGSGPGSSDTGSSDTGGAAVSELGYPLLRRATVARLTHLWLLHLRGKGSGGSGTRSDSGFSSSSKAGGWAAAARRDVGRILLLLFRLHRGGLQSRSAVEFLHISKAAGTSMCRLAEVSGCRAQDFSMGRTCLMRDFDDQPRWINGTHHWKLIATAAEPWGAHPYAFLMYGVPRGPKRKRTCSLRLALLDKHRLNFFANEYTIYNDLTSFNVTQPGVDLHAVAAPAGVPSPPRPPRLPPAPPAPPQPPLSVVLEATAERYSAFVSQLLAEEGGGGPVGAATGGGGGGRYLAESGFIGRRGGGGGGGGWPIMKGAHLCRQFANVAVMRDPGERFMSHLKFIAQTYGTMYKWPGIAQAFSPGRTSGAWWRAFSPPLFDSYMLRSLGGEAVFAMSYDSLEAGAESYMALARAMLAQYDVILALESDEYGHRRAFHFGLGWRHLLAEFQLRNASALMKKMAELQVLGANMSLLLPEDSLLQELKNFAIRYDNQLYQYGMLLAALDDVVWRVAAEVLGEPLSGFSSGQVPRCGYVHTAGSVLPSPTGSPLVPPPLQPAR